MLDNREKLYQIYHAILSMVLTWALVLVINHYFTLKIPVALTAIYSLIPVLLVYLFDVYKRHAISYIILVSILPLLAFIFWILKINPVTCARDYYNWIETYNGTKELYIVSFAHFTVLAITLIGAILFYLITKKQLAKLVLAIIILGTMLVLCINHIYINKAVVGIAVFYMLSIVIEFYGVLYSRREGREDKREGILYLAPICLLLTILSISLPSKSEPIKWTFVKDIYHNISEQISVWQTDFSYYFGNSNSEFTLARTGYSDRNGNLYNNKIAKDDRIALKIIGAGGGSPVYLTGSISDIYTGYSWEKSKENYLKGEQDYLLDYEEMFFAISRLDPKVLESNSFVKNRSIKIIYNNIKTKTFFYPLKTSYYDFSSSNHKISDEQSQIMFHKARGKGTSYKDHFYDMNLQGEAFENMLRQADSFSYDSTKEFNEEAARALEKGLFYSDNIDTVTNRQDIYRVLGERAKIIRQNDTKLPENLPERVIKLANDITAPYDTTYDKLKAIEAFLVQYKYTLSPERAPKGQDFVDYFLFDSKEGYCTSFATAMAVLGRCIGVPTRYVEGFVVKGSNTQEFDMVEVRNSQAHAWAEAYINGIGWIPFEATAPFYDTRYTKWAEVDKNAKGNVPAINPEDFIPKMEQSSSMQIHGKRDIEIQKKDDNFANAIIILFMVLTGLVLAVIIYYWILTLRYHRAYKRADNGNKMYLLFLRILNLLKKNGFSLEQQETILMLSKRVKDYHQYNNVTFQEVANVFMCYRYAEREITKEQLGKVERFQIGFAGKHKEGESRFLLWIEEFIFLIQIDRQLKYLYSNT